MNETQAVILNIFKEVAKVCERNQITYFAIGGTCLGAVRHKGFIPWDDDLDIAIPIEKYFEFIDIAKKELPNYLEILDCRSNPHYSDVYIKVMDKRTTLIETSKMNYPKEYGGVYVDIMPISGVPSEEKERKKFIKEVRHLFLYNITLRHDAKRYKNTHWKLKTLAYLMTPAKAVLNYNYFTNKYYKTIKHYPLKDAEYTGYVWDSSINRLIFPIKDFEDTVLLDFEDTKIRCPQGWRDYLTIQFGDFMELPPVDQRPVHSGFTDTLHPYKEYADKTRNLPLSRIN